MNLSLMLVLAVPRLFSAEEAPKASTQAINKAIEAQMAGPLKAYDAYQKALEDANKKIIESLEKMKADASDVKKGSMSLKERSSLVDEIDQKVAELKKGGLGEMVVAKSGGDMLGEFNGTEVSRVILGKWKSDRVSDSGEVLFSEENICTFSNGMKGSYKVNKKTILVTWSNGAKFEIYLPLVNGLTKVETWI